MSRALISHIESKVALASTLTHTNVRIQLSMFSQGYHELSMKKLYVTGSENLSAPHVHKLISPPPHTPYPSTPKAIFHNSSLQTPSFLHCTGVSSPSPAQPCCLNFFPRKKNLLSNAAAVSVRDRKRQRDRYLQRKKEGRIGDAALMFRECLCTHCLISCVIFILQVQVILPTVPSFNSLATPLTMSPSISSSLPIRSASSLCAGYMRIILQIERVRERPQSSAAFTCRVLLMPHLSSSPPPPLSFSPLISILLFHSSFS